MYDNPIPLTRVIAAALWAVVGLLVATGWGLLLAGEVHVAVMFGLTGCATSAAAATAHIRSYSVRICALLRAMRQDDLPRPPVARGPSDELHLLRER